MQAIHRGIRQEMVEGFSLVQQNFILYENHTKTSSFTLFLTSTSLLPTARFYQLNLSSFASPITLVTTHSAHRHAQSFSIIKQYNSTLFFILTALLCLSFTRKLSSKKVYFHCFYFVTSHS